MLRGTSGLLRDYDLLSQYRRLSLTCDPWAIIFSLPAKVFIEPVSIFRERPGKKSKSPIFRNTLNAGLSSFVFTIGGHMQYTERGHTKHELKTRFYSNSVALLVIVAPTLKVVRYLFHTFYLHVVRSIWFRCRMIVYV